MVPVVLVMVLVPMAIPTPAWVLHHIAVPDPLLLHKINRLAASVVAVAMFAPIFLMTVRHVQVNRLAHNSHGLLNNDDGLLINQHRLRVVANIDAAIHTGLVNAN